MTVFTWTNQTPDPNDADNDQFNTFWYTPVALCLLCGEPFKRGDRVMGWMAPTPITIHAECVKASARGLLKDIGECLQ